MQAAKAIVIMLIVHTVLIAILASVYLVRNKPILAYVDQLMLNPVNQFKRSNDYKIQGDSRIGAYVTLALMLVIFVVLCVILAKGK